MKTFGLWRGWSVGLAAGLSLLPVANGAPVTARPPRESPARTSCDDVCDLRAQDQAFTLLLETFREFRAFQIQRQYDTRLEQVQAISEESGALLIATEFTGVSQMRLWLRQLIELEREQELRKLHAMVAQLRVGYECARKEDELATGETVPMESNYPAAARRLQGLRVRVDTGPTKAVHPVTDYLLNVPWLEPPPGTALGGCSIEPAPLASPAP